MARQIHRLSARFVATTKTVGYHNDGGGLHLQVTKSGAKSWVFKYMRHGKTTEMGLGAFQDNSLEAARRKAAAQRAILNEGRDPKEERDRLRAVDTSDEAKVMTFDACAKAFIDAHQAGWRNAKHADQWKNTIDTYASPVFGALPVQTVDTALVMKVLDGIWKTKTETATRLRGRIENVLDWATVRGYRVGENPARWRGHLDKLLPKRSKVQRVVHHEAMPYARMPAFLKELRARDGVAARALEFVILTACRAGEALASPGRDPKATKAIAATWDEIDFDAKVWTVPEGRMKAGREHRIPLSDAAIKVLESVKPIRVDDYIFPGWRSGAPMTIAAPLALLKRDMGHSAFTVHGFRSTFRDWAAETTNFPRDLCEAALAHVLESKAEAAYQRGDKLERRRRLMEAWAQYCSKEAADVVPLAGRRRKSA